LSSPFADWAYPRAGGIWRSVDKGKSWKKVSGDKMTGLPDGGSYCLVPDPARPARLLTNGGPDGIYESLNTGAMWTKISEATMDALIAKSDNVKISFGCRGVLYVAIDEKVADRVGQLSGMFRSVNGGKTWTAMDLPMTVEGGLHPGTGGWIHFSLAADPGNPDLVYLGGDRQVPTKGTSFPKPNSIRAKDFSGRLFRGDASLPKGKQWVNLTHAHIAQLPEAGQRTGALRTQTPAACGVTLRDACWNPMTVESTAEPSRNPTRAIGFP